MLLVFIGIAAILVGLLAMHALTSDTTMGRGAPASESSMLTMAGTAVALAESASSGMSLSHGCTGACDLGHEMLGSACVLALLITVLLFTLHLFVVSRPEARRVFQALVAKASALVPPAPPSLEVLSISRT